MPSFQLAELDSVVLNGGRKIRHGLRVRLDEGFQAGTVAIATKVDEQVQGVDKPFGSLVRKPQRVDRVHDVAQRRNIRTQSNAIHWVRCARLNVDSHLENGAGISDIHTLDFLGVETTLQSHDVKGRDLKNLERARQTFVQEDKELVTDETHSGQVMAVVRLPLVQHLFSHTGGHDIFTLR